VCVWPQIQSYSVMSLFSYSFSSYPPPVFSFLFIYSSSCFSPPSSYPLPFCILFLASPTNWWHEQIVLSQSEMDSQYYEAGVSKWFWNKNGTEYLINSVICSTLGKTGTNMFTVVNKLVYYLLRHCSSDRDLPEVCCWNLRLRLVLLADQTTTLSPKY
jgi:hypothetical protein